MNKDFEDLSTWTQNNLVSAIDRAQLADRAVVDAALPWIHDGGYSFIIVHVDQVDYAGHHEGGPRDPRWDAAVWRSDTLLREIAAGLYFERD